MANLFDDVRPGDLISASAWNKVLQVLQSHEDRLNALVGTSTGDGTPRISSFSPSSDIHVGDEFNVFGVNFGLPGSSLVTIDDARITTFEPGSGDGLLKFQIPAVTVNDGKTVILTVVNAKGGSGSTNFFLQPARVTLPTGQLLPAITAPAGTTFAAGASFTLSYTITATTTLDETYDLLPAVDAAGWQVNIVDSSTPPKVVQSPTVFIQKSASASQPVTVQGNLQVVIPVGATGSSPIRLTVRSRNNPTVLVRTSGDFLVSIGSSPVSSPNITVVPAAIPPRFLDADGRTVLIPTGATGLAVSFNVSVVNSGSYLAAARFDTDPSHWHGLVSSPVSIAAGPVPFVVPVTVTVDAGAAKSNVFLKITSQSSPTQATEVSVPVKLKP